MGLKGVLTPLEKCCVWLLMVCGLIPFRLNTSENRFVLSTAHYWGSVLGTVAYVIASPWLFWIPISRVEHPSTPLNYYMMVIQFLFMYIVVTMSRLKALVNRRKLCQLLNALLALREQTLQGSSEASFAPTLVRKLFVKLIVFDLGMMILCASFFRMYLNLKLSFLYSFIGFLNLLLVSSMNVAINFLLFVLYNAINIYMLINARCTDLVYGGSNAAKATVRLYLMHTETTLIVQSIVEVISMPVLLLSIWFFFIIVFSVFYTYTSLVQDLQMGSMDALRNVINPIAFFISEVAQVYFLVSASATFTGSAQKIISCVSLYTGRVSDGPGDQAIELLTIEHLNRDYAIRIKGLFAVDNTMLFSIVATTTSYMIILVQYYLQE
ncbi:putative gustatory receptor 28a [Anopheles maculipalpis]|uniref:putative gustatory receptor 28a n=1 Tax=Anopheles maculipalpis TaxID=1496333 RepID=UPI002158B975|nr:putative gustatory receptor 28a [Anopheles maculipalpis]